MVKFLLQNCCRNSITYLTMAQHNFSHIISSDVTIPEFLKRLQCSDVSEGDKAHLKCQVIGDPGNYKTIDFY